MHQHPSTEPPQRWPLFATGILAGQFILLGGICLFHGDYAYALGCLTSLILIIAATKII